MLVDMEELPRDVSGKVVVTKGQREGQSGAEASQARKVRRATGQLSSHTKTRE